MCRISDIRFHGAGGEGGAPRSLGYRFFAAMFIVTDVAICLSRNRRNPARCGVNYKSQMVCLYVGGLARFVFMCSYE